MEKESVRNRAIFDLLPCYCAAKRHKKLVATASVDDRCGLWDAGTGETPEAEMVPLMDYWTRSRDEGGGHYSTFGARARFFEARRSAWQIRHGHRRRRHCPRNYGEEGVTRPAD